MTYAAAGVTVRIGGATLLDDVSLELRPGELVAMAGPNGAGKSTLLATLAGDRAPTAGVTTLDGRPVREWAWAELARRRAVMAGEHEVAFAFNAEEVVTLGRMPSHGGHPAEADRAIVADLLEAVDGSHLAARPFATLSTGERQRVSLARAVAQIAAVPGSDSDDPRYLLLDEPTSSLDPAHQHLAMRLLRRVAEAGCGVLAVLHDVNLASAWADRLVLLHEGRIVAAGSPAAVLDEALLGSVFGLPMLVVPHPRRAHPLVVADPPEDT
jgi:iron complex transport system ATP-binding protein